MKNALIAAAVAVVVVVLAFMFVKPVQQVTNQVGASTGPDHYNLEQFFGGVLLGNVNATSTPISMTLRTSDLAGKDTVLMTPTIGSITVTFPASSTAASWLPTAGQRQRTCFQNATSTAAATIVFAAGTGIDLETASSTPSDLTLVGGNTACFDFIRGIKTASKFDITAAMVEYNDGD